MPAEIHDEVRKIIFRNEYSTSDNLETRIMQNYLNAVLSDFQPLYQVTFLKVSTGTIH